MKRFVHAMLSAAAVAVLASCVSTEDAARQEIIDDLNSYMEAYSESPEAENCNFSSESAKEIFEKIPALQQQKNIKYLSFDMESNDGKSVVRSMFAPNEKLKLRFQDEKGKVLLSLILNNKTVYLSSDGIQYKKADAKLTAALRFLYDSTVKFPECTKKVEVQTFDAYKFGKKDEARKTVKEPLEIMIDGIRCYCFNVSFLSNTYSADLKLYVTADDMMNLVRVESMPKTGLEGTARNQTTINSRFFYQDGFVFPGLTQVNNGKTVNEMTMKNISVNKEFPESEFTPDILN